MTLDEALSEIERLRAALYEIGFTVGPPPIWYRECARFRLGRDQILSSYDPSDPGATPEETERSGATTISGNRPRQLN